MQSEDHNIKKSNEHGIFRKVENLSEIMCLFPAFSVHFIAPVGHSWQVTQSFSLGAFHTVDNSRICVVYQFTAKNSFFVLMCL